jgi:thiamine kinase-like enzyme
MDFKEEYLTMKNVVDFIAKKELREKMNEDQKVAERLTELSRLLHEDALTKDEKNELISGINDVISEQGKILMKCYKIAKKIGYEYEKLGNQYKELGSQYNDLRDDYGKVCEDAGWMQEFIFTEDLEQEFKEYKKEMQEYQKEFEREEELKEGDTQTR